MFLAKRTFFKKIFTFEHKYSIIILQFIRQKEIRFVMTLCYGFVESIKPSPFPLFLKKIGRMSNQTPITYLDSDDYEFHFIIEGEGTYTINDETYVLSAGDCFFAKKHVKRRYKKNGEILSTAWITFNGCHELIDYYDMPDYKIFKIPDALAGEQRQILYMCHNGSNDAMRSAMVYSWLINVLEYINNENKTVYTVIKDYMEENFAKNITLEKIASLVGMNKYALCRYYKNENLGSVMDQLCQIRLGKAKTYLSDSNISIASIASYCGFNDASYFGKVFKEKMGISPRKYRLTYSKVKK